MNSNTFNFIDYVFITIIAIILSVSFLSAQECPDYNRLIVQGDKALKEKDYNRAINRYIVALRHCKSRAEDTQKKIIEVFTKITVLKNKAEENEKRAVEALEQLEIQAAAAEAAKQEAIKAADEAKRQEKLARIAEQEAKIARDSTENLLGKLSTEKLKTDMASKLAKEEQEKNERILNALDFYEDSLALGVKRGIDGLFYYGFIDKGGNFKIECKYKYASIFDRTGYAKVELESREYLIDISGNEYPVAYDINNLTSNITALDLRNKQIKKFPSEVFKYPQLKIVLLSDNPLKNIPLIKIEDKLNLITLDIDEDVEFLAESTSQPTNFKAPYRAKVIQTPIDYIKPTINVDIIGIKEKVSASGGRYDWVVSSDRNNNIVYDKPDGIPNGMSMDFMESFYVIGENNTYLQLIKYNPAIISSGTSRRVDMKKAEYYGWVSKNKLLLWRNPLVNVITNSDIKGLAVHSVGRLVKGLGGEQQLIFYNSPTLEKMTKNENDIRLSTPLYVYDKKNDSYLLGTSPELRRSNAASKKIIKGWMSDKYIRLWESRLCLEPNSHPKAVAERKSKGIKANLFTNYDAALRFKTGKVVSLSKILWDDDQYEQSYSPSQNRMPIMGEIEGKIYKTGVITEVFNKSNKRVYSAAEYAKLNAEYNVVRDKKQNINMIFVIDGTQSNHSFFTPIINALKNSLELFKNTDKRYEIATFIYGKSGEGVIARQPLTSNRLVVIKTLENYRDKTDLTQDNDDPTDMYEAINTALRTLDPKETNIMVLIGDTGNALSISKFNLIQKMKEKECGIISFQTRNPTGLHGRIYNDFVSQIKNLIEESSKRINLRPTLYQNESNTFRLRYPVEAVLPGYINYSDKGATMAQADLEEKIMEMLKVFEKQHEELLRNLDCQIYIECNPSINDAVLEHIIKEIPDIDLRKLRDMDYQLFVEAYAPVQIDQLEYPLFKYVLFLSDRELYDLERKIQRLIPAVSTPSEVREGIIRVYQEIINIHYGSDIPVTNMTIGQTMKVIVGLPATSDLLNAYTLKDLMDNRKVSDDEIREIYYYIDEKLVGMKKIIGNPNYFFRSRDNTYYWVPLEMIP